MNQKAFLAVSGTIFGVVGILHLGRILAGWPAHIGPFEAPMWLSWVAAALAGYLAVTAFRLRR
jgi:hypothetical protein